MTINLFDKRTMLQAFLQGFEPRTFLMKTFFSHSVTFETKSVDIDIRRGKRRVAPFVRPRKGGKTVDRGGFETKSYTPPLVAPQDPTTAEDLLKRTPGETIYGDEKTPEQRAAERLGQDMAELDKMITRREEYMAAQALFDGAIHMYDEEEGIDEVMDFNLPKAALSGTSLWSDPGADPLADLRVWAEELRKNSGYSPDRVIMGTDAMEAFLKNGLVEKAMNTRRVDMGEIKPRELPNGVGYIGNISRPGVYVDLYTYDEWVYDEAKGKDVSLVHPKKILLANPASRYEMLYGAIANTKIGVVAAPRVPFSWEEPDGSARWLRISSRPLPVPVDINASIRCSVLV